jgi:hypothetical protein
LLSLLSCSEQAELFEAKTREKAKAIVQASIQRLEAEHRTKEEELSAKLAEALQEIQAQQQAIDQLNLIVEEKDYKYQQLTKTVQTLFANVRKQQQNQQPNQQPTTRNNNEDQGDQQDNGPLTFDIVH